MRSSVKGSLRAFSASTYVTSSSMSVDCAPPKKFQCQKSSNGTGCCSHVARGSCWTPTPLRIQDQSLHSWCTHCTLLMRFAPEERKENTWLKFPHNSFNNSALFCSFCILLISGSIYFTLLHWHFFLSMIIKVG